MFQSNILSQSISFKTQGAALLTGAFLALSSIQPAVAGAITANPDEGAGDAGETIRIDVLANDTGLGSKPVSVTLVSGPSNGTAKVNAKNKVVYESDPGFSGTDTVKYKVTRSNGTSDKALVTIAVAGGAPAEPQAPIANDDEAWGDPATRIRTVVLDNDTNLGPNPVTLAVVVPPSHGKAWFNTNDKLVYQSDAGFNGIDTVTYSVRRENGASDRAELTVQVGDVTDPGAGNSVPVAMDDSGTANAGAGSMIEILANDDGLLDGPLSVDLVQMPANGQASVNADNTVTYTPFADFEGSDDFTYRITDADGETATAVVTMNVQCPDCTRDRNVTVAWNPNPENVSGYWVVYGDSPENATQYLSDLATESGNFNPSAPSVIYSAAAELGAASGDRVCFRIGARVDLLESKLSEAVCTTI